MAEDGSILTLRSSPNLSQDEVWRCLHNKTNSLLQAHRGWAFEEEGYVRNVRWKTSDDSRICLVRGVCLPSIKKAPYTVSAWFARGTGSVIGGTCSYITFQKYLVNRPVKEKKRRSFDPCENVGVASAEEIKQLRDALSVATQGLQWLLYSGVQQLGPAAPVLSIQDNEDLWSKNARDVVGKHMESLPTLTDEEREEVTRSTIGQANNARKGSRAELQRQSFLLLSNVSSLSTW
ncbi:hypothetical protein HPB47_021136 [Ixodes persulcatus]|uniref:Uncharacterized protein n=1 Tax=Ixodes persulcatus TaxID=34615 RepID=A0AC60QE88_IXOPE|nr:hypothetical protein HPB47_021136 [Ixodes persulcatus]